MPQPDPQPEVDRIVADLRAALDADERTAKAAACEAGERWRASAPGLYNESEPSRMPGPFATGVWGDLDDEVAAHMERYDPASVLGLVAAHREILDLHAEAYDACRACGGYYPCATVRALAAAYADGGESGRPA